MRSFRSKPTGWQNDSYRHYLAAKGISSTQKRYYAHGLLDNLPAELEVKMLKERRAAELRGRVQDELIAAELRGEISSRTTNDFIENVFAKELGFYMDGTYDYQRFEDEVMRQLHRDIQTHNKKLSLPFLSDKGWGA